MFASGLCVGFASRSSSLVITRGLYDRPWKDCVWWIVSYFVVVDIQSPNISLD